MGTLTLNRLNGINTGQPPIWFSGRTTQQGELIQSPTDWEIYVRKTATGGGTTDPADDSTNYNATSYLRVTALPVRTRRSSNAFNSISYWANGAVITTPASIGAGVRTQILSLTGRGNLQFAGVYLVTGNPASTRLEVFRDGASVLDTTLSAFTAGEGFILAGLAIDAQISVTGTLYLMTDYTAVPIDTLPFRRSCQIYITPTNALTSPSLRLGYMFASEA